MVVSSCLRLLLRRLVLKKGLFLTAALFLVLGAFGLFYFFSSNHYDSHPVDTRVVLVPTLQKFPDSINQNTPSPFSNNNTSLNLSQRLDTHFDEHTGKNQPDYPNSDKNRSNVSNSHRSLHVLLDTSPECVFSSTQPAPGNIDVQVSDVMDLIDFDNPDGGVWKQGFDISYSKDDLEMLKVFLVPHSHNDPGWLRTFEDYYRRQTRNILSLMTSALSLDERRKFIWAEISYLDLWWQEQNQQKRDQFKRLIQNGQLEIVTGGWVMNDEANTHYFAMLDQLIEGHLWMKENLPGAIPRSGWANDPFGYTPTMAYLLSQMGLEAMMIQRVHYSVKKHFARNKYLEFGWTQQWDQSGSDTAILCHMMPFYSYDIPHTCGPDPKVCCQFDFKRLKGSKVNCPWGKRPQVITNGNLKEKAETLTDQYRKKAQLYRSNVLLVPLGDDFRWDTQKEIDDQFSNYFKLIDYINGQPALKMNVQFGTLTDYFNAVKESLEPSRLNPILPANFPTLTGDFFTYSDKDSEFWSGYFTSRPFYKHFERVLETYLRRAEIFRSLVAAKGLTLPADSSGLLTKARRSLGLFQHHDGITGTAKEAVVKDYANKMFEALTSASHIAQAAVKSLLSSDSNSADLSGMTFDLEESYPNSYSLASSKRIEISEGRDRVVSFVNSLAHKQMKKMVSLKVNTVDVMVKDHRYVTVPCQVNPRFDGDVISSEEFELVFLADIPALGVSHYYLQHGTEGTIKATVQYINIALKPNNLFHTQKYPSTDFVLTNNQGMEVKFSGTTGLLKSFSEGSNKVDLDIDFISYGTVSTKQKSGAYLFLPNKEAKTIISAWGKPPITVVVGPLLQKVSSKVGVVQHCVQLFNSPGQDGRSVAIDNLVDVSKESNKEFAMRFRTSIDNPDEVFYTDLNGFQLIRRRTYSKIPLQGNYYPMPTTAVIQDQSNRLTLFSGQPLGVAALKKGWLEVMLDRRLMQDDSRGLGQGLKDNLLTFEPFRLLIERRLGNVSPTAHLIYPSLLAHSTLDLLLHPLHAFISQSPPPSINLQPYTPLKRPFPCDLHLVNLRSLFDTDSTQMALILHRRGFECGFDIGSLQCELTNGNVKLGDMFDGVNMLEATQTSLSLLHDRMVIDSDLQFSVDIDPMQIQAYRIAFQR